MQPHLYQKCAIKLKTRLVEKHMNVQHQQHLYQSQQPGSCLTSWPAVTLLLLEIQAFGRGIAHNVKRVSIGFTLSSNGFMSVSYDRRLDSYHLQLTNCDHCKIICFLACINCQSICPWYCSVLSVEHAPCPHPTTCSILNGCVKWSHCQSAGSKCAKDDPISVLAFCLLMITILKL